MHGRLLRRRRRNFFFKQKTAYELGVRLVGSEMCRRDSPHSKPARDAVPARRARARRRRRAWCTRGLLFHLSLYFCGLHGAAAWSQVQLCGTSLTQSAEPDLSQLCRARCHSSKSKFLTRLRALYSLWRPVQSQALTSSDWLEQLRRLKCPAPRFLSLVSDFLRRVERDLRGEKTRLNTKINDVPSAPSA